MRNSNEGIYMNKNTITVFFLVVCFSGDVFAAEPVDLEMVTKIRAEGFQNSHVMETIAYLSDIIGPRLTGSPQMKEANDWTRDTLKNWGIKSAWVEGWGEFGPGWTNPLVECCSTAVVLWRIYFLGLL